jgi:hypothetical protein
LREKGFLKIVNKNLVLPKQEFKKGFFQVRMSGVCRTYIAIRSGVIKNRKTGEILKQERPYDD